jgi:lysylphosphatidylglycerol synthetase-like protein (DUF2156 family)
MHQELLLRAITHSTSGVAIIAVLLLLLIGVRKELNGDDPVRGIVHLCVVVMGLCTFLALIVAMFLAKKICCAVSSRLGTAESRVDCGSFG